jgi:hypothetical protein
MLFNPGIGLLIENTCAGVLSPPPGAGLKAVIFAVPVLVRLAADIVAANWVALI